MSIRSSTYLAAGGRHSAIVSPSDVGRLYSGRVLTRG